MRIYKGFIVWRLAREFERRKDIDVWKRDSLPRYDSPSHTHTFTHTHTQSTNTDTQWLPVLSCGCLAARFVTEVLDVWAVKHCNTL